MSTRTLAVVSAGLRKPSSTRLLADQLATAAERAFEPSHGGCLADNDNDGQGESDSHHQQTPGADEDGRAGDPEISPRRAHRREPIIRTYE